MTDSVFMLVWPAMETVIVKMEVMSRMVESTINTVFPRIVPVLEYCPCNLSCYIKKIVPALEEYPHGRTLPHPRRFVSARGFRSQAYIPAVFLETAAEDILKGMLRCRFQAESGRILEKCDQQKSAAAA